MSSPKLTVAEQFHLLFLDQGPTPGHFLLVPLGFAFQSARQLHSKIKQNKQLMVGADKSNGT
jgi:hypothetical protein